MPKIEYATSDVIIPNKEFRIFRLAPLNITSNDVLELSKKFTLKGTLDVGRISITENIIQYFESGYQIKHCLKSGAFRFRNTVKSKIDSGKSIIEFDKQNAIKIAGNFINASKHIPIDETGEIKFNKTVTKQILTDGTSAEERIIEVGIIFPRVIDEIPVDSPGGKAFVYINHDYEITGFDCYWRQIQSTEATVSASEIHPPSFALERLQSHVEYSFATKIEVKEIRFGYFEDGWGHTQEFVQPAYIIPYTLFSRAGIKSTAMFVISALKKPYGEIMQRPPEKIIQYPRQK